MQSVILQGGKNFCSEDSFRNGVTKQQKLQIFKSEKKKNRCTKFKKKKNAPVTTVKFGV